MFGIAPAAITHERDGQSFLLDGFHTPGPRVGSQSTPRPSSHWAFLGLAPSRPLTSQGQGCGCTSSTRHRLNTHYVFSKCVHINTTLIFLISFNFNCPSLLYPKLDTAQKIELLYLANYQTGKGTKVSVSRCI